jgi:uncharacterized protein DUF4136
MSIMRQRRVASAGPSIAAGLALAALCWSGAVVRPEAQADITVNYDKKFSFTGLTTWAWHPDGTGDVKMAVSSSDDPAKLAARVDPILVPAVEREMTAKKVSMAPVESAKMYLRYYVLVTVGQQSQFQGQFLPATVNWGLPPFAPVTTALSVYPVGTLVLDVTTPEPREIVWRGAAKRKIDIEKPDAERRKVLERAVRDLIKKLPVKG